MKFSNYPHTFFFSLRTHQKYVHAQRIILWELKQNKNKKLLTNDLRSLRIKLKILNLKSNKLNYPYSIWSLSVINRYFHVCFKYQIMRYKVVVK